MRVLLVQHGDALSRDVHPDRPLSERGRNDVARIAAQLAGRGVVMDRILHSGKTRARQTAELLASRLAPNVAIETTDGINPMDATQAFAAAVKEFNGDVLVVGHLPFMAKLVTRLTAGREQPAAVEFRPGSVVCLERGEGNHWAICWMLRPDVV